MIGKTKKGTEVWIDFCPDTEENKGGFYCRIYNNPDGSDFFDDFVIRAEELSEENIPELMAKKYVEAIIDY